MRPSLVLAALLALPALALAQGSLTPPGVPAPTMKTLTQLEPRTPLQAGAPGVTVNANGGFTITDPGSYYMTADLTVASDNGIVISASDVSLDLAGFTITCSATVPPSADESAIITPSRQENIAISNGHIRSGTTVSAGTVTRAGFAYGIRAGYCHSWIITGITVSGTGLDGISTATEDAIVVRDCTVFTCGGTGIYASAVTNCSVTFCARNGIQATNVISCVGRAYFAGIVADEATNSCGIAYTDGTGIHAAVATNCAGISGSGIGLMVARSAINCVGTTSSGDFGARINGTAENCNGSSGAGTGLYAITATNCKGTTDGSGFGLEATVATGCYAQSTSNTALQVATNAENCHGVATGTGYGLYCGGNALNCYGSTYSGAYGIYVVGTGNTCRGKNEGAGAADFSLHAGIAVACTSAKGAIEAANRYQMPASP